jgi:outer membrane protein assembly factor BamB
LAYGGGQLFVPCDEGIQALAVDTVGRTVTKSWKTPLGHPGAPIYTAGVVWAADTDAGILTALKAADGTVLATIKVGAIKHFTSPTAAHGLLLIGTSTNVQAYR